MFEFLYSSLWLWIQCLIFSEVFEIDEDHVSVKLCNSNTQFKSKFTFRWFFFNVISTWFVMSGLISGRHWREILHSRPRPGPSKCSWEVPWTICHVSPSFLSCFMAIGQAASSNSFIFIEFNGCHWQFNLEMFCWAWDVGRSFESLVTSGRVAQPRSKIWFVPR